MNRPLALAAAVVTILVFASLLWLADPFKWRNAEYSATPPPITPTGTLTASTLPQPTSAVTPSGTTSDAREEEADEVAEALELLVEDPEAGAAEETRPTVDPDTALPPGSKITPDRSTWAPDGIGGGTMNVILSAEGQPDRRYVAVMVKEDGNWKVLATLNQTETGTLP